MTDRGLAKLVDRNKLREEIAKYLYYCNHKGESLDWEQTRVDIKRNYCRQADHILVLPTLSAALQALEVVRECQPELQDANVRLGEILDNLDPVLEVWKMYQAGRVMRLAKDQSVPLPDTHLISWELRAWQMGVDRLRKAGFRRVEAADDVQTRPPVVCLCGSTRFSDAFQKAQLDLTLQDKIVLTIGCNMRSDTEVFSAYSEDEKVAIKSRLDELHLRKIDQADEVLILNVGGYIGESTQRELDYARSRRKKVSFLEPESRRVKAETEEQPEAPHD